MWLFLQQRCKIFVAIWQLQKNKPLRGLMFYLFRLQQITNVSVFFVGQQWKKFEIN